MSVEAETAAAAARRMAKCMTGNNLVFESQRIAATLDSRKLLLSTYILLKLPSWPWRSL